MEQEFNEVAARTVLAYLYDHDMYRLAEQFCMANPYLEADRQFLAKGNMPVNFMQKPLQLVMKEFILMQSQLLQLVNLCSSVVSFPDSPSLLELGDHLIKVLKSSGTGQVLKAVISTLPICTDFDETQTTTAPVPVPPSVVENTNGIVQSSPDETFPSDTLLGQDIIITASEMGLLDTITRCVESDTMPIIVENTMFSGQSSAVKASPPQSVITQSNLTSTSTPSTTTVLMTSPHQTNQPHKSVQNVTQQLVARDIAPTVTYPLPPIAEQQASKEKVEKLPPLTGTVNLATGVARSNATPLDHPIAPGAVSSRSTSSRKQSHIRILDFGTPPLKRGSPSTFGPSPVIPSPCLSVPQRAVPVLKLTPTASLADRLQPPVPTANEEPKPKKVIVKRRLKRCGVRKQIKRFVGTKLSFQKLIKRPIPKRKVHSPNSVHQQSDTTNSNQPPNVSKSNRNSEQTKENACTAKYAPAICVSPAKALPNMFRPPSASPPRTVGPSSPACPVDPLTFCPMTPRFLTRPLQPLCMLSPLLGSLDASAISQIKSISHTKRTTDINTPGYPITPGNAITPSPPPDSVSYYESEPGTGSNARHTVPDDETDESEPDSGSPGVPKPQLTLTASEGSAEIAIQYVERERLPPVVEQDHEIDAQLAARIEIDNGNRVFQIAVSPIITLYEDYP